MNFQLKMGKGDAQHVASFLSQKGLMPFSGRLVLWFQGDTCLKQVLCCTHDAFVCACRT